MKYAKTVAVVAGSVAALGAAAPAFAATTPTAPRLSLTTGVNELTSTAPQIPDQVVNPVVGAVGQTAEAVHEDGTVARSAETVTGVAGEAGSLLGGLPLGR
ncbi:hypothetical protein B046DRAFT_03838 [Streptomyces sp. LamerLS-316]|uniref:hypothetical protein n=1 Tax=unclassified Streptomyces TaxID=2593676 RepID=UPI0008238EC7|nr:hypothetical protein [Streptomyces sp. LamerLS-316]MYQ39071.1 hypothetical protein [Streptomyces sp. SID4921]SCK40878.1 hypothetical protein B046DRAFT_03838 [Streptomyces sp. LamerLS-316]